MSERIHCDHCEAVIPLDVTLEFVRELASTSCAWGCIADHPDEQPCIHCRAAKWLHSEDEPDPIASVPPGDEAFAPPFRRTKP